MRIGRIGGIVGTSSTCKDSQIVDGPVGLIEGAAIIANLK